MLQHRAHLFERDAGEPLDELRHQGAIFKVLEERRNGHARTPKNPCPAHATRDPFDERAGRPIDHAKNTNTVSPLRRLHGVRGQECRDPLLAVAQIWNGAELARAFGIAEPTVKRYLDLLANTFIVRVLPPWSDSMGKRVVKTPKVYIADTGLLHTLLDIPSARALQAQPKVGASFEGFALQEVVRAAPRTAGAVLLLGNP